MFLACIALLGWGAYLLSMQFKKRKLSLKETGYLWAILYISMGGFNGIISNAFANRLTPLELTFGRWFIAALCLIPVLIHYRHDLKTYIKKYWKLFCVMGLLGMALPNFAFYTAGHTTSALNMVLVNRIYPVFVFIMSVVFLKERGSLHQMLGMGLALFGVFYLVLKGSLENLIHMNFVAGDLWVLASAFVFASYSIIQERRPTDISQILQLTLTVWAASLILMPFFAYEQMTSGHVLHLTLGEWGVLVFLGLGLSVLGYFAWNTIIERFGSVKASVFTFATPLVTAFWAYVLLGDGVSLEQIIGGVFILLGVYIADKPDKRKKLHLEF